MPLGDLFARLAADFDRLSLHFRDFAARKARVNDPTHFSELDECLLEGLLSRAWQSWCLFGREFVVESCRGTVDASGTPIAGLIAAVSDEAVSGAAIRAGRAPASPSYWGASPNSMLRKEPTWGDADVLVRILQRLSPTNAGKAQAAISNAWQYCKAVQTIRNGTAHNNPQTLVDVRSLASSYVAFPITHPTQALFWIDSTTSDFLITSAVASLLDAAESATH